MFNPLASAVHGPDLSGLQPNFPPREVSNVAALGDGLQSILDTDVEDGDKDSAEDVHDSDSPEKELNHEAPRQLTQAPARLPLLDTAGERLTDVVAHCRSSPWRRRHQV